MVSGLHGNPCMDTSAMVDSGNQWKTRDCRANTWGSRVDTWRVKDFVTTVETSLREAASPCRARQYGQVGESLKQLASGAAA